MSNKWIEQQLDVLNEQGLYRSMLDIDSATGPRVRVDGQEKLAFCSNNYLGLAGHSDIVTVVQDGVAHWGFGAGASRLISGNQSPHGKLQQRLARWLGKQAALVFSTGYMTNLAILGALPGKDDLILLDKLVHASIVDGAKSSDATVRVFPHRQIDKIHRLLERGGFRQAYIVTESLFSMDGDSADLVELVELKKKYEACLIVDEAHALGCIGPGGKGCAAETGLLGDVDIVVGTFSKALGGAGGFVAADRSIVEILINKARPFIYTTGVPAVHCLAAETALNIIDREPQRRKKLNENARILRNRLNEMELNTAASDSYIIPIVVGDAQTTVDLSVKLWEAGIMIPAIRPPTVAPGSSRLRISLMCEHTSADLDSLCDCLQKVSAANHLGQVK